MFAKLLQLQLLPGDAQQRLIATLSIDKKQQMISMHGALLADDAAASKSRFTAGEDGALLQLIRDADAACAEGGASGAGALGGALSVRGALFQLTQRLGELHTRLKTANREWLRGFLDHGGLELVSAVARKRLIRDPFLKPDLAAVEAALRCFKTICNNADGLAAVVSARGALDVLAACCEPTAALASVHGEALDILCVAVWASDGARSAVLRSLTRLSHQRLEAPFAFARALVKRSKSVPVKAKTMALCNQIIMKAPELEERCAWRNCLLAAGVPSAALEEAAKAERLYEAYDPDDDDDDDDDEDSDDDAEVEIRGTLVHDPENGVDPRNGKMKGSLVAAKARSAKINAVAKALGGKATKHRIYELDEGILSWSMEKDDEVTKSEQRVYMDEVLVVRPATTHQEILAVAPLAVELVFAPPRHPLVLGVEDERDHDAWFTAFKVARRDAAFYGGEKESMGEASKDVRANRARSELAPDQLLAETKNLRKQCEIFRAVSDADREITVQPLLGDGVDGADSLSFTRERRRELEAGLADGGDPYVGAAPTQERKHRKARSAWSSHALALGAMVERQREREAELAAALPPPPPAPVVVVRAPPGATAAADPAYAKFHKMLRMHVPRGAVEAKMAAEGLDPRLDDAPPPAAAAPVAAAAPRKKKRPSSASRPCSPRAARRSQRRCRGAPAAAGGAASDPKYAKYFKMLAMHIPKPAVMMKMSAEGLDPRVLDGGGAAGPPLRDDPKYAKYFKMLAMHVPKGAVAAKMLGEGLDASLLDCDPSKPAPPGQGQRPPPPKKKAAGKKAAAGARLKGAFWTKLGDDDLKGTLWADLDEGRGRAGSTVPLPSRDALVAAFGTTKAAKDDKPKEKKPKGPVLTHLVDGKRNQNVLIGLGRVKLSPAETRDALVALDVDKLPSLGDASGAEIWLGLIPTDEETQLVTGWLTANGGDGALEKLAPVEKFFAVVSGAPRLKQRLEALRDMHRFGEALEDARGKASLLRAGCAQLDAAAKQKGGALRSRTPRGAALAATLAGDLAGVGAAAAVDALEIAGDLRKLEAALAKSVGAELEVSRKGGDGSASKFVETFGPFYADATDKLKRAHDDYAETKTLALGVKKKFGAGDEPTLQDGGCAIKAFLAQVRDFAAAFETARLANVKKRQLAALEAKRKAERAARDAAKARKAEAAEAHKKKLADLPPGEAPPPPPSDDLFNAFAASQNASADEMLANFQRGVAAKLDARRAQVVADDASSESGWSDSD
ncbi:hypothetical protein JL720_10136 [Aureococcus anophagefferens]|nr:hypothetical protein JL720_10136 [Aureococcus anophagefferens]